VLAVALLGAFRRGPTAPPPPEPEAAMAAGHPAG
jgi:hypothetical protein